MHFKPLFARLTRTLSGLFFAMNTVTTLLVLLGYALICYLLLLYAGETDLIALDNFFYYLVVSSSTVGYGDYGPSTPMGKWVVSFWVIPIGISLFALILTKVGMYLSEFHARGRKGLRMQKLANHIVVIGWNGSRTLRLIELIRAKTNLHKEELVLCATQEMENPLPGKIHFVRAESFSHPETMARANIQAANRIIIDTPQDDMTLTTALYCAQVNPECHKAAYLHDESLIDLLRVHCPKVEVVPSVSTEMLARSALDPKSSQVHKQLLDSTDGMTQYRCQYLPNSDAKTLNFGHIFQSMKLQHNATVIGIHPEGEERVSLNPSLQTQLKSGDAIYYIADQRLTHEQCFTPSPAL